jgi:hypothetical protein
MSFALLGTVMGNLDSVLLDGAVATAVMAIVSEGCQVFGLSRMSLPFLLGTIVSDKRARSMLYGFALAFIIGWLFAVVYAALIEQIGIHRWWVGALIGAMHGLFIVFIALPLLPYVHPRMASEYDGPTSRLRLEPPGPFGLHYGYATPVVAIVSQVMYGIIFASLYPG